METLPLRALRVRRFQGTADAVRQYSWIFGDLKNNALEDIIILSGDHLYRMDYMRFVEYHRRSGADCTIGCLPCNEADASAFGLMKIDDDANITEFAEKPSGEALQAMKVWVRLRRPVCVCPRRSTGCWRWGLLYPDPPQDTVPRWVGSTCGRLARLYAHVYHPARCSHGIGSRY